MTSFVPFNLPDQEHIMLKKGAYIKFERYIFLITYILSLKDVLMETLSDYLSHLKNQTLFSPILSVDIYWDKDMGADNQTN